MKTRLPYSLRALSICSFALGLVFAGVCAKAQSPTQVSNALANTTEGFHIVAPFPPGGPIDLLARLLSSELSERYKVTSVVDNVPGGAGNIGMDRVKKAKADGHTLLVIPAGNLTINPSLMSDFPFNIERDFSPVTLLAKAPNVLVASPALHVKSVSELVAYAKAQKSPLAFASPGVGSGLHLAGELFKQQAGIELLHVPYKGTAPALNDVLGGQVPLMFSNLPGALPFIKNGKLVAIGLTDSARALSAPEIATLQEQGVSGVVVNSWYGLLAPSATPVSVIEALAKDAQEMLGKAQTQEQLKAQGLSETKMSPQEFAQLIKSESAQWAKIIKAKNIVME
jgi:tripartite-type tricarboxylate transporter receptor subunit TctC